MFFNVHLVHYIHYLLQNMISEKEKDQIFKEMVFEKGLFYFSDTNKNRIKQAYQKLENDFENKEDFIRAVNSLLHANGLHFYSKLRTLTNQSEFIGYIQNPSAANCLQVTVDCTTTNTGENCMSSEATPRRVWHKNAANACSVNLFKVL